MWKTFEWHVDNINDQNMRDNLKQSLVPENKLEWKRQKLRGFWTSKLGQEWTGVGIIGIVLRRP